MGPSSFTTSQRVADRFASPKNEYDNGQSVLVEVRPGAKAFPVSHLAEDQHFFGQFEEQVTAGRFKVVSVTDAGYKGTSKIILEQIDTYEVAT